MNLVRRSELQGYLSKASQAFENLTIKVLEEPVKKRFVLKNVTLRNK